jgi:hypothetical protein
MNQSKYTQEKNEVQYVVSHASIFLLPFRIVTDVPLLLARALRSFLRGRGYNNYGVSTDNDGVWIRKYKE